MYFVSSLLLTPLSTVYSLDILSLWGFLTSTSVMESTQNALCERKTLTVDLGQAAACPSKKDAQSLKGREMVACYSAADQ